VNQGARQAFDAGVRSVTKGITAEQVKAEAASMGKSAYAAYLWELLRQAGDR
jgi:hypothetical protein